MMKPRLKGFGQLRAGDEITLVRDAGVELTLPDPDGQVAALLDLLDGTRAAADLAGELGGRWSDLTPTDVAEGLAALDDAGLLEDTAAATTLTPWQQERYFSNLAFFGTFATLGRSRYDFQEALRRAHVVLLGVGGLGSTLLYNLAGLGVGHVTALDCDRVEAKNLARQFLYSEAEIGQPKLARAVARARAFNSEMEITPVERRVAGPGDVVPLLSGADLVLGAIDQPADVPRWVNEACVQAGVPYITGGMWTARGMYYSVAPGRSGCLACLRTHQERERGGERTPVRRERVNRGIGPVASLIGALISLEAVRYLTGFAPPISQGRMWVVDFATGQVDVGYEWPRLPDCPLCAVRAGGPKRARAVVEMDLVAPNAPPIPALVGAARQ